MKSDQGTVRFRLEHFLHSDGVCTEVPLVRLPFRVGRNSGADYVIPSRNVSKMHAEFFVENDQLHVRDLNSTNGTFVNGIGVQRRALKSGDIVQLATVELRVLSGVGAEAPPGSVPRALSNHYQTILRRALHENAVRAVFQPIVRLESGAVIGFEALGRALTEEVCVSTSELFAVAELSQSAADLSRAFRQAALRDAVKIPGEFRLFINVHPEEMLESHFLTQLREGLADFPSRCSVVLEVHEGDLLDSAAMRHFHERVHQLGLKVAYDDFGTGRPRLDDLGEAPPDCIKLDPRLVRAIDRCFDHREMVKTLKHLCKRHGIAMIAEGIETQAEADCCQQLGCRLGQGYLFARPQSIELLGSTSRTDEVSFQAVFERLGMQR